MPANRTGRKIVSRKVSPRRSVCLTPSCAPQLEPLEGRRLCSAAAGQDVALLDCKGRPEQVRSGEWILGMNPGADAVAGKSADAQLAKLNRLLAGRGGDGHATRRLGRSGQYLVELPASLPYDKLLKAARKLPGFRYFEPNRMLSGDVLPNDGPFDQT